MRQRRHHSARIEFSSIYRKEETVMKYDRAFALAAIAALPLAAFAQTPTVVESGDTGKDLQLGHEQMELPQDVLWDSLWIVDNDVVDFGNGDAISGMAIFGTIYDLQVADAFEIQDCYCITNVVMDYLNFFGTYPPMTDVHVEFFEDLGGYPAEVPIYQLMWTNWTFYPIFVSWWGPCTRIEVFIDVCEVRLDPGVWWVAMQPVDTTSGGDWYYICRKNEILFLDSYFRDGGTDHGTKYGGPYGGGYGSDDWISATSFGYPGTSSFRVEGDLCGGGLTLTVEGDCPGLMNACVSGATPSGTVAFVYGACGGQTVIPNGMPCAGTVLDVGGAKLACTTVADGGGNACCSGYVPQAGCVLCVQAIDVTTCATSNVVAL